MAEEVGIGESVVYEFYELDICAVGSSCLCGLFGLDLAVFGPTVGDYGFFGLVYIYELGSFGHQIWHWVNIVIF